MILKGAGENGFSVELIGSDVENVRVAVRSAEPAVPPTVPKQSTPANPPTPATPPAPGDAVPPEAALTDHATAGPPLRMKAGLRLPTPNFRPRFR